MANGINEVIIPPSTEKPDGDIIQRPPKDNTSKGKGIILG